MGGWAVAQSPIMITTVTLERLHKRGYEAMLDYYSKVSPQLNEPLYPAIGGTYSGVRGAPHRLQAVRPSTRLCAGMLSHVDCELIPVLALLNKRY